MRISIVLILSLFACKPSSERKAQQTIDNAIEVAGGENYDKAIINFDFRDYHYVSNRDGGLFSYHRIKSDSAGEVHDILNNAGFERLINNRKSQVADTMAVKYSNSINSVIYFVLLPYGLNDKAVNKNYIGEATINGKDYHKIRVTFDAEGGGVDFEDVFIYWISKDEFFVDYLAYEYHTEGGGKRFRKAVKPRYIKDIRFVDYINYKPAEEYKNLPIEKIDSLFKVGIMEKLSEIRLNNVRVSYN